MAISPGGRPADASPLGKKAGPRGLTDYIREVAHALMRRDPSMSLSTAIAIARSQQGKWAVKSKNPAIRSASAASLAAQHVLDHRKRGKRDLSWQAFDASRPKGAPRQAAAKPVAKQRQPAQPDRLSAKTHKNVMAFQKAHGLAPTGNVDAATVAWLNNPKNKGAAGKASGSKPKLTAAQKAAKKQATAQRRAAAVRKRAVASLAKKTRSYRASAKAQAGRSVAKNKAAARYVYKNAGVAASQGHATRTTH